MSAPAKARVAPKHPVQAGVTLVELMIALTLSLVAVGAALSIYLANRKSFALVESVARTQEGARFAVDLLSRDIREAGGTACGGGLRAVNTVPNTNPNPNTWALWERGLVGDVLGSAAGQITGPSGGTAQITSPATDALLLWSASSGNNPVQITAHTHNADGSGTFSTASDPGYKDRDVLTACDGAQLFTFEAHGDSTASGVSYTSATALTQNITAGGYLNPLSTKVWYVGNSTNGASPSLRRLSIAKNGSVVPNGNAEIVPNVTDMQIQYLLGDGAGTPAAATYVDAAAVADWSKVLAVRVTLTFATPDTVGSTGGANAVVSHTVPFVVSLRTRL